MLELFFNSPASMIVTTGAVVGIAASLVGTFLVLRGSAMLSDAISHSIVFGIIITWLLTKQASGPAQIIGAALTGVLTVFLTELLTSSKKVKADAAIGLVFPALFSVGVLLISIYARDIHIDEHTVLLGEIGFVWLNTYTVAGLEIPQSLIWMSTMLLINLAFVIIFFKELKLTSFDPALAKALGFAPTALFYALLVLTSGTAVAAFDSVGAILFVAFVIVPPSAAYLLTDKLERVLILSAIFAVIASIAGYALAMKLNVSIGGSMALMTGLIFMLSFLFSPRYGLIAQNIRRRAQAHNNALRTLTVHLYSHGNNENDNIESLTSALNTHLKWSAEKSSKVVSTALSQNLIIEHDKHLTLTNTGRVLAREILEPWATSQST